MSEDHTEKKTVMPDIVRHLLDTVPVSPLSPGIIDYNQPEWLAEFNRRGERIAELEKMAEARKLANRLLEQERNELESKLDRLREALKEVLNCEVVTDNGDYSKGGTGFDCNEVKEIIRGAQEGAGK